MEVEERIERVYEFIKKFWQENKYSPSVRDILEGLRIGSTDTVRRDLLALREAKRIDFQDGQARTIVVVDMEIVFLDGVDDWIGSLDEVLV